MQESSPEKPFGRAYLDRNLTIRPLSKLSLEERVAQLQRSAGNMGELSPAFPKSWIGRKAKADPLTLQFLKKEDLVYKKTPERETPSAKLDA
jgi:hypothetical protein